MPKLTQWYIRLALVYLAVALLVGVVQVAQEVLALPPAVASLWPVYIHLLAIGWLTQLIFGVAYWMFPRYSKERHYGSTRLAWATFIGLNAGLVLRALGEPLYALAAQAGWGWLLAASALLQWLAGIRFAASTWVRIRER